MKLDPLKWEWFGDKESGKSVLIAEDSFGKRGIAYDVYEQEQNYGSLEFRPIGPSLLPFDYKLAYAYLLDHIVGHDVPEVLHEKKEA